MMLIKTNNMDFKISSGWLIFALFLNSILSIQDATAQNVLKGPYLVEPGKTSMLIRWEMETKSDYSVEYGLTTKKTKINLKLNNKTDLFNIEAARLACKQIGITDEQFYKSISGFDFKTLN